MKYEELKSKYLDRYNVSVEDSKKYSKGKIYKFTCNKCKNQWEWKLRFDRAIVCRNCYLVGTSRGEIELYNLLNTSDLIVEHNNRQIIAPKELDIYFPEFNFAIEYDGGYWHNEDKDAEKDLICKEKGINLLRIDDQYYLENKEEVLKSIKNYLKENYNIDLNIRPELVEKTTSVSAKCKK